MKLSMKIIAILAISSSVSVAPAFAGVMFDFVPRYEFAEPKPKVSKDKTAVSGVCVAQSSSKQNDGKNCDHHGKQIVETAPTKLSN
jgi:hypothetical protein